MKVVVDANVMVSGLRIGPQPPVQILDLWREGAIDLLASEETLAELARVLDYPKIRQLTSFSDDRVQHFLEEFRKETILVEVQTEVKVVVKDPTDTMFLALAVAGCADCIITGDTKHLLPLKSYHGIPIVSPSTFLTLYHQTADEE